ncbi:hypothetical protein A2V54_02635 [candidate division WWE3 bacterium RBG_19FT_COMBO_53_11]|uniref:Haloacid dehalogenase n=1 Tax=candidate division WWE3 bacterium RBG_19FT_COMBO_53_11 TaxID=1802613 RepID=A0A1F4UJD0_UNCKA|nr:MAG: hypothetical protein A2155_00705 [candidate division WWE3 bacterium RBG_16_52_45]OGC44972.1 MAG: hypothetical protein A2V54_02635 [candidate division WWE3 bacterium RBG_19FT_COMBO_53_11]
MAPRKQPRVFLWDLDDTLMWTSWAYSRAFSKFHDYLLELFDYRLIELRTLGTLSEQIDKDLIRAENPDTGKPYGYGMERFPTSLVKTYEWLCERGYGEYRELVARRIKMIGMEAFDPLGYKQQGLVKGARETLDYIREQGDVQILITKGEVLVQDYKIVALDLDRWFGEEIYIVDSKNKGTFEEHQRRFPVSRMYSVGNSYPSDVQPALEAGISAIYIPYYTWLGEGSDAEVDPARVLQLRKVDEIIGLYKAGILA